MLSTACGGVTSVLHGNMEKFTSSVNIEKKESKLRKL